MQSSRPTSRSLESPFHKLIVRISARPENQPSPLRSTTLHSMGKSKQVVTWFLNRFFHTKTYCGSGNSSECNPDICPTMKLCGNSTGIVELAVDGLLANVGIGIVPCMCCNWEVSCRIVTWFSLNFCTEISSTRCSRALWICPISCIFLIWVSRRPFSFKDNSSGSRTCSRLDSTNPYCAS